MPTRVRCDWRRTSASGHVRGANERRQRALRDRQLTAITTLHLVGRLLSGNFQQPQQRNAAVREIGAGMAANDY